MAGAHSIVSTLGFAGGLTASHRPRHAASAIAVLFIAAKTEPAPNGELSPAAGSLAHAGRAKGPSRFPPDVGR